MPAYRLQLHWHTDTFRRTVRIGGQATQLVFRKDAPVELSDEQLAAIKAAGGAPIQVVKPKSPAAAAATKRSKK